MENFLIKNRKAFMVLFGNLFFLCLILILNGQFTHLLINKFIDVDVLIYLSIILPFLWFFFFIKKNEKYYKEKIEPYFSYFMLLILTLITFLYSQLNFANTTNINKYVILIFIILSFYTFYFNKNNLNNTMVVDSTQNLGRKTTSKFYILPLLIIIILFTAIKAPFFSTSFTGEQSKKYNASVEPAMYMAEKNNPLISVKKYLADPISNPNGNFKGYLQPPLMEWGLAITYKIFPENSIEFNTRIFMNISGILLIIFIFLFLKKIFSIKESLVATFLISLNPVVNLCSYATVYDGIMTLFAFASLLVLKKFLKEKKILKLFYASTLFGISVCMKYSVFLWLTPLSLILICSNFKNKVEIVKLLLIYNIFPLIMLMIVRVSFKEISINPFKSIMILCTLSICYLMINISIIKWEEKINKIIEKLLKNTVVLIAFPILILSLLLAYIKIFQIKTSIFLTSSRVIFEPKIYEYILNLISVYSTKLILILGLLGIILTIIFEKKSKKSRIFILGLSIGSVVYLIIASKVIFFHEYYTLIFQLTLTIATVHFLKNLLKISSTSKIKRIISFVVMILLLTTLTMELFIGTKKMVSSTKNGYLEATQYLISNTKPSDFFIPQYSTNFFSIYTKRPSLDRFSYIENQEFKNIVKEKGLKSAMDEINIKYIISTKQTVDLLPFASLFTNEKLSSSDLGDTRESRMLMKTGVDNTPADDTAVKRKIIEENNVDKKIQLEKQIGDYYFFIFKD
jgi:hypothetical protein